MHQLSKQPPSSPRTSKSSIPPGYLSDPNLRRMDLPKIVVVSLMQEGGWRTVSDLHFAGGGALRTGSLPAQLGSLDEMGFLNVRVRGEDSATKDRARGNDGRFIEKEYSITSEGREAYLRIAQLFAGVSIKALRNIKKDAHT
jgi:hypothetical protein